ncbi:DUF1327 domain-containing protein [Providencia rettgeri]|nr:DUF1327 domain-containing protein [Providencia rettgeri]EJD6643060.1 DUF1327 domain-containing protein [Providencia rettgeri]ELL9155524.1 DUF1327 domain-containing protein [Providencia rettgeri]ELR5048816.1 DUF1327 domain-containing protein [Providencia rettgeri]ELR5063707.1 DUF1327 domain-containing protein [Providencia rettgeri]
MSKKYEYNANNFTHIDSAINVQVCVAPSNFNLLPIFTISVPVEKKDGKGIDYYRAEAIKRAKEVIVDIAKEASVSDLHQNEGEFSGVIVASGDLSLEERVTALEKQITDMQAAMSCDLEASKSIIFSIQAAIENNEKAFNETLRELQSRFTVSNHGDAHFKGVIISK